MKIRHPLLTATLGFLIAGLIRIWILTVRYRHRQLGELDLTPHQPDLPGRFIYAFWHEDMLVPAYQYARPDVHVLISRHADGQLIAAAMKWLGLRVIFGSTNRGGADAIFQMREAAHDSHLVMTPDGPRGPRQRVHLGMIYVAARTGLPIIPVGFGYAKAWRAGSWDRMALPKPFSRVLGITLPPICVPDVDDRQVLELYRQQVEEAMQKATLMAQHAVDSCDSQVPAFGPKPFVKREAHELSLPAHDQASEAC